MNVTDVDAAHLDDATIVRDSWVKLTVADVQCNHTVRSPAQQHVTEASRRGSDIKASQTIRGTQTILCEQFEGAHQLVGASGNVTVTLIGRNHIGLRDLGRCFGDDDAVDTDLAVGNQTLRLGTTVR